jgi:hypothetical protein
MKSVVNSLDRMSVQYGTVHQSLDVCVYVCVCVPSSSCLSDEVMSHSARPSVCLPIYHSLSHNPAHHPQINSQSVEYILSSTYLS